MSTNVSGFTGLLLELISAITEDSASFEFFAFLLGGDSFGAFACPLPSPFSDLPAPEDRLVPVL